MLVKEQAKVGSIKYTGEPSVQGIVGYRKHPDLGGDSTTTAFEGLVDVIEYAKRIKFGQSKDLDQMFIEARVRNALKKQGYPNDLIEMALGEVGFGDKPKLKDVEKYREDLRRAKDERDELRAMELADNEARIRKEIEDKRITELAKQARV